MNNDTVRGPSMDEEEEQEETAAVIFAQERDSNIHLAVTSEQFHLLRFRPAVAMIGRDPGVIITLNDQNQVDHVVGPCDGGRLDENMKNQLTDVLTGLIKKTPDSHIGFYLRAGPLNLKMHAFQLLPGVGKRIAKEMQGARERGDWSSFENIEKDVGLDPAHALAVRYVEELTDEIMKPRLVELLLRAPV